MSQRVPFLLLCASAVASGCAHVPARLTLELQHLPALEPARGHYAAWVESNGRAYFAGQPGAGPLQLPALPAPPTRVFITQERPDAQHDVPGKQVFLQGVPRGGERFALAAPIDPKDFAAARGGYLLDNPVTNAEKQESDNYNGIWFAHIVSKRYVPALALPPTPPGWLYSAWLLLDGHALKLGKFASGQDNDDWDGYSGRNGASALVTMGMPPMPGEDFVAKLPPGLATGKNLPALDGGRLIVTLDNATLANEDVYPSPLRLLEATIPAHPRRVENYELVNVVSTSLPSGSASLE